MADETISTRIVANADFSSLIADVHKVTASLSKLQEKLASSNKMMANQIAVMNRSFSDTLRSTGQFSTHFVSLTSDVEKFGKNLDGGKLKLNQYFNAFRDQTKTSGGLIRDLAKQQVALQNSVLQPLGRNAQGLMQFNVQVPRGLDAVKNATAIARTEMQIMNKVVQDGAGQIINFGKNTQWTGRQLTVGLTVPLVAFGNAAAKAFREADQELVRLTKVYGDVAGTSAAELGKVRDDVVQTSKEISQAMGVSFKETIALAADIAATGKTGDDLLGSVRETTRLAVLGEVDRQEAMKATLAIQSAFKQNTDELSESINFLNAVENQTSTTLNDLVEAIPKAGPVIQGLGGSVQDLALYLTAMREGGINASEGANALKSALASLINPTDVAVKKFQGLGIDLLGVVNNNAGDLTGTLMALQGALDSLDPLQKQQAIEQLFGKFQFSRLNALFENLGRQGSQTLQVLDLMKESTDGLAQVADRELTAVTESASGKYRRALEGLKASLAEVGEQFLQINTVLITVIDKIVQFAMNLPGPVKQILALLGGVTAIAGPLIMLTGLLANFFGNMAKGVFHIKAFLKGGEGFKYLTPEMLAAEKAGKLVEQSFYSDAKAAAVLQQALRNLLDEFSLLEAKAKSGSMSISPAVSTMAGNLVMAGGGRVVNPAHPLVGPMGSRASSHMVPRSGMSEAERLQQTIFGMVPGSIPVNQKIGQNPQIYMNDNLPDVPGLTKIGGTSTGIVAGEAAKHHAMMATLAMQSKAEIDELKKQMVATGLLSKDFMNQFDDILPIVSKLTDNAARESALIVSELRAGKLNVEQARAKIIALNLETERMISSSMQAHATSMGRTLNPTMVPTLNQPVVDAAGKSNMRELFKKGKTRDFINKVAGALGVRTSGAGYNIETTVPKRLNRGNIVPGTGNTDTVPAMLTPGEFVVNKEATQRNLPLLHAINQGTLGGPVSSEQGGYGLRPSAADIARMFGGSFSRAKSHATVAVRGNPLSRHYWSTATGRDTNARRSDLIESHMSGWAVKNPQGRAYTQKELESLSSDEVNAIWSGVDRSHFAPGMSKNASGQYVSPALFGPQPRYGLGGNLSLNEGGDPKTILSSLNSTPLNPFSTMRSAARQLGYPSKDIDSAFGKAWEDLTRGLRARGSAFGKDSDTFEEFAGNILKKNLKDLKIPASNVNFYDEMQKLGTARGVGIRGSGASVVANDPDIVFRNKGGIIPGYNAGGVIGNVLKSTAFKNLGAKFGKIGDSWGATSLSLGMGKKLFGSSGLTPKAQNLMYGKLISNLEKERPYGYVTNAQGHLQRALEPDIVDVLIKSSASDVLSSGGKSLSKIDREILRSKYANWDNKSWTPSTSKLRKQMFGMNRGGMVPGYNLGGMVPKIQYLNDGDEVQAQAPRRGGRILGGIGAGLAVGYGGQMLGSKVGGPVGTAIQIASMIASMGMGFGAGGGTKGGGMVSRQMDKIPTQLKQPIGPLNGLAQAAAKTGGSLSGILRVFGPLLKGFSTLLKLTSPLGLAITGLTAGIGLFVKIKREQAKALETGRLAYGMDAEAAEKAGFKYTDYNAKIKTAIEDAKALKEKNIMVYESMTRANVPMTMTIEQYKKLKEQVKSTMGSYIDLFSQTDRKDVGTVAVQLKAQFMAAGDSAETATAKVFTMIKQSENANMAAQAISTNAFQSIQNMEQASAQTVKTFEAAMKTGDAESQARALHSVFQAMDASLQSTVDEQKKLGDTGEDTANRVASAVENKLNKINQLFGTQANLSKGVIDEIRKTDPLLAEMLNDTDTLNSAWAKYRLTISGVAMNFQFMSGEAAIAANQLNEIVKAQVQLNPAVAAANKTYKGMTDEIARLEKAQKGQSVKAQYNAKEETDRLQKQIAAIKKAAQDKIEGIRKATDAENTQLEIQKAQLRAQQQLIQGNMSAYAEEQMTIEQLMNESNRKDAEEAILAKADIDIKPLQDKLDAMADKQEAMGKKAALAGESLTGLRSKADTYNSGLTEYTTNLNNLMTKLQIEGDKFKMTDEFKTTMTALEKLGTSLNIKTTPQQVLDQIGAALSKNQILAQEVNILTGKIRDGSITGAGTMKDPFSLGAQGIGTGGEIKGAYLSSYGNPLKDWGEVGIGQKLKNFAYKQGLVMGDYFSAEDKDGKVSVFKVKDEDGNIVRVKNPYENKSLGGPVVAGQKYMVNDRVNPLGYQGEGFIPNMSGTIYPNIATMPRFDIPSGTQMSGVNNIGSQGSSNVYNIDIALNGTTVTADDVMRSFKRELALVNAKEGIDRRFGGSH
jgi:TP901 family phage tail tape measure protein